MEFIPKWLAWEIVRRCNLHCVHYRSSSELEANVPNNDLCAYEGRSYLYGLYYKTGTAYWEGVLKTDHNNGTGIDPDNKVVSRIDIGKGYSETPNIHTGREAGSKAFVQTSTGAIISIEQANPGITKSRKASWQEY